MVFIKTYEAPCDLTFINSSCSYPGPHLHTTAVSAASLPFSKDLFTCSCLYPKSADTGTFLPRFSLGPYSMPPDPKAFWNHLQKIPYAFMNAGTCCCLPHCSPCPWASFSCQMSLAEFIHVSLLVEWKLHGKRVSVNIPTVQNSARNLLKTLFKINEQLGITRTVYPF